MCPPFLSSELALRVATAAGRLGVETKTFVPVLVECVGLPFTKSRFGKTTVNRVAESLARSDDPAANYAAGERDALKSAVQTLWGFRADDESRLPETTGSVDDPADGAIRVAVASSDGQWIDEHFGGTLRFFVFQVAPDGSALIDIRSTRDAVDAEDGSEFRVDLIQDCQILYVRSIGGPPAGKVTQRGIHPMKVEQRVAIPDELARLQTKMGNSPPPWLAKAMGVPVEDRIRFTEASQS